MPYMLLIVEPTEQRGTRTEAEGREVYERMLQWGRQLRDRGLLLGGESLASQAEATRVQVRQGQRRLLDGPFAEAKEMVGGFFLLDCANQAQAVELAAECPAAQWCTVEVRAVAPCYA